MIDDTMNIKLVTRHSGVIPARILNSVRSEAARVAPTLDPGRAYRTEDVCIGIWDRLSTQEHKDAGRALKYLANSGAVRLRCIGMDSSHRALYVRID